MSPSPPLPPFSFSETLKHIQMGDGVGGGLSGDLPGVEVVKVTAKTVASYFLKNLKFRSARKQGRLRETNLGALKGTERKRAKQGRPRP